MVLTPQARALFTQKSLIGFADAFQEVADAVQVAELLANLGDLVGMEADLPVLAAGVIDIEDPLPMALA
jgi:hypothetical protein